MPDDSMDERDVLKTVVPLLVQKCRDEDLAKFRIVVDMTGDSPKADIITVPNRVEVTLEIDSSAETDSLKSLVKKVIETPIELGLMPTPRKRPFVPNWDFGEPGDEE